MTLINKSIPSLFNGVSQQPATLRHDTQAELSENAYPTIATGLRKRPPLTYLALLTRDIISNASVHIINRSVTERYAVFVRSGSLQVFSLIDGTPRTVTAPAGLGYLTSSNPADDFGFVTVADYTFILNRSVTVTQQTASAAKPTNVAYFAIVLSEPSIIYTASVDGHSVSYSTPSTSDSTTVIANNLAAQLVTALGAGYSAFVLPNSSIIKVQKLNGTALTQASCSDGYANTATLNMTKAVSSYSKLPPAFEPGYTIEITGDPTGGASTYYVAWDGNSWVETAAPGLKNTIEPGTMPWKLIRQSDGTFLFTYVDWEPRRVGDDTSNPAPSFIGRAIADIFYYRGRLGFLADENVCLSRAGEYYNFWAKTATAVIDTDPIDTNVGTNKVSILKFAVPFDKSLLLFSDQTQFQLTGGDALTPKSVRADVATEFDSGTIARPVGIGQAVYFGVTSGARTGIREYFVDATTLTNDATDVTAHVPTYIPGVLHKLVASSSEDVLFALCRDEPGSVYVYKFFWSGNTKSQSAWQRFTFGADTTVLGAEFINNRCYFIVNRSDGTYIEVMDLQPDQSPEGMGFDVLLDHRITLNGTYDSAADQTHFTLPYAISTVDHEMVLGPAFTGQVGKIVEFTVSGSTAVTASGRYDQGKVFFGQRYKMTYRFSQQYAKDQNQVAITNGKLKLRRFYVDYTTSGSFRAEVQPKSRDTFTYKFTGKTLGTSWSTLGTPSIQSGTFTFPVLTSNEGVRIDLINDTYLPSTFQSAGWDAEFVTFGRRM